MKRSERREAGRSDTDARQGEWENAAGSGSTYSSDARHRAERRQSLVFLQAQSPELIDGRDHNAQLSAFHSTMGRGPQRSSKSAYGILLSCRSIAFCCNAGACSACSY